MRMLLVGLVVLVAGCGSDATAPEIPTLTGEWYSLGLDAEWNLTISEGPDGMLSGGGDVTVNGTSLSLTILSGTHAYPNVTMTIGSSGVQDMNFTGDVSPDGEAVEGELNGSGYTDEPFVLSRDFRG